MIPLNNSNVNQESIPELIPLYSQTRKLLSTFTFSEAEWHLPLKGWIHNKVISLLNPAALDADKQKRLVTVLQTILNATKEGLSGEAQQTILTFFKEMQIPMVFTLLCLSKENALETPLYEILNQKIETLRPLKEETALVFASFAPIINLIQTHLKKETEELVACQNLNLEEIEQFEGVKKCSSVTRKKELVKTIDQKDLNFFIFLAEAEKKLIRLLSRFNSLFNPPLREIRQTLCQEHSHYHFARLNTCLNNLILYLNLFSQAVKKREDAREEAERLYPSKKEEKSETDGQISSALQEFRLLLQKMKNAKQQDVEDVFTLCKEIFHLALDPLKEEAKVRTAVYAHTKNTLKKSLKEDVKKFKKGEKGILTDTKKGFGLFKDQLIRSSWQKDVQAAQYQHDTLNTLTNQASNTLWQKLYTSLANTRTSYQIFLHYLTAIQKEIRSYQSLSLNFSSHIESELEGIDEYEEETLIEEVKTPLPTKTKPSKQKTIPAATKVEEPRIVEEIPTALPIVENKTLDKDTLLTFIQDATSSGIQSTKASGSVPSTESTDHFFMAGCGFEIFARLLFEGDSQLIGAIYPSLLLDWHVQIEQALSSRYIEIHRCLPMSHSLIELAEICSITLSNEMQNFIQTIDQGLLWSRYPCSSLERYESKHKTLPNGLKWLQFSQQLMEGKISPSEKEWKAFIHFIVEAHRFSLQFERQLKGTHFFSHLLKHFQPGGSVATTLLELPFRKSVVHKIEETEIALKLIDQMPTTAALQDCRHHLIRLQAAQALSQKFNTANFFAWHIRNCTHMQWALEAIYVTQYFNQTKKLLYIHDFSLFQQLLNEENESHHQTALKFNFGIGAHYPRRKQASHPFFGPFIRSIEQSKRAYDFNSGTLNQEGNQLLLKTQQLIKEEGFPAICYFLKSFQKSNNWIKV